jgi:hypothetical protein
MCERARPFTLSAVAWKFNQDACNGNLLWRVSETVKLDRPRKGTQELSKTLMVMSQRASKAWT